jgi:hypothetical protein
MADERRCVHDIDRPLTDNLVGDVHAIYRLGVANFGNHTASFRAFGLCYKLRSRTRARGQHLNTSAIDLD